MPLSGGNGLTADGIRQLFRQRGELRYGDAVDEPAKQSKIEGLDYTQAGALHWALMDSSRPRGYEISYGWIDPQERKYLEHLGLAKTFLDNVDKQRPAVDYLLFKFETFHPFHIRTPARVGDKLWMRLSTEDADRFVEGALRVYEEYTQSLKRISYPNAGTAMLYEPTPTGRPDIEVRLCTFFAQRPQASVRYASQKQRLYQLAGPEVCY